jgi:hypothetical protein
MQNKFIKEPCGSIQAIKIEQLYGMLGNKDLVIPETLTKHVSTNDLRTTKHLEFVFLEVYALVATANRKLRTTYMS